MKYFVSYMAASPVASVNSHTTEMSSGASHKWSGHKTFWSLACGHYFTSRLETLFPSGFIRCSSHSIKVWATNTLWVRPCLSVYRVFPTGVGNLHDQGHCCTIGNLYSLLCNNGIGCHIFAQKWPLVTFVQNGLSNYKQWPQITLVQQWPTWCGMKDTIGMSVFCKK
jgi:hypothetical protein